MRGVPAFSRRSIVVLVAVFATTAMVTPALATGSGSPPTDAGAPAPGIGLHRTDVEGPAPGTIRDRTDADRPPSALAASPGEGVPERTDTGDDPGPEPVANVTLVTGQTVRVLRNGNRTVYEVDADVPVRRVETPDGTYVYPAGVDFEMYDPALFNVDLLIEQGLVDGETGSIPVIVDLDRPSDRGGDGPVALGRAAPDLQEFEHRRDLESIGAVAGRVSKDGLEDDDGSAVDPLAVGAAPAVDRVYLDRVYEVTTNESREAISADRARRTYDLDGSGVTVAVLDTGVDAGHPDLDDGTVVDSRDFTTDGTVEDRIGHGTHVAATVAGDGDASNGTYRGVAPNASIMNLRVLGSSGRGQTSWIVDGIEYATNNSADVLSISLGGRASGDDPLVRAVQRATDRGATVVVAAGNSGPNSRTIASPAVAPDVVSVGAYDGTTDGVAWFSSRGPTPITGDIKPDVVAPGVGIVSACVPSNPRGCTDGQYTSLDGTSMAAPHVSGVAALMLERNPDWGPRRVKNALLSTAEPLSGDDVTVYDQGAGLVNASRAVDPGLVVENATTSLGTAVGEERLSRTVTVRNTGDRTRSLDVEVALSTDDGEDVPGRVAVNRTTLELAPGERADVRITVSTGGPLGDYSGRLRFVGDGRTYTAVFGYVQAERVVIEKRGIDGTDVEGDDVWVVPESGPGSSTPLEVEDGRVTFPTTADTNYSVITTGVDESTGTPLVLGASVTGDDATLDESRTSPYRIDAGELRAEHGALTNASVRAHLAIEPRLRTVGMTVLENFTRTRTVRFGYVGGDPDGAPAEVTVEALLVPADHVDRSDGRTLDSPTVYHLVYDDRGIDGPERFVVDRDDLARVDRTYYRRGTGTSYELLPVAYATRGPLVSDDGYRWSLDGRTEQTLYVTGGTARYVTYLYQRRDDASVRDWPRSIAITDPAPGEREVEAFNRPPYTPRTDLTVDGDDDLAMASFFQRDQRPSRTYYTNPTVESTVTVRVGGEVIGEEAFPGFYGRVFEPGLPSDGVVNVTVVTPDRSSAGTVTEYRTVDRALDGERPPGLAGLRFEGLEPSGRLADDDVELRVNLTAAERIDGLTVLYTTDEDPAVPVRGGRVRDVDGWSEATVTREDPTAFTAAFDAGDGESVSVAILAVDGWGNTLATTVLDAVDAPEGAPGPVNESVLVPYTNDDGVVDTPGLARAVEDWADDEITTRTLGRVVQAWATGEPVD